MPGPRIYNLFPLLAGPVPQWSDHLERIAAMAFDWVFVNPFHYPGFSGSLYAVKDYYRLHPLLAADGADPESLLKGFTRAAAKRRIAVMMDLVINHTSKDSVLVAEHPEWFRRDPDGELRSPRAIDPVDPRKFTVWGDLAEIDYDNPNTRPALIEYWVELVRHHLKLGFKGFRCDAAYQVPAEVWQPIVRHGEGARSRVPVLRRDARLHAGAGAGAASGAGFDFLFNSAKWWDFRAPWLLEQYDLYRQVAPTVAFPESHDTERLAMELGDPEPPELERHYRLRYLFAAAFSSGVMMPMGYEYGCRTPLDVVGSRPGDWAWETAEPRLDLTGFVGAVNRMKAATPALNVEGPQKRITAPHSPVVGLLRLSGGDVAVVGRRRDRADQPRSRAPARDRSRAADQPGRRPHRRLRGRHAGRPGAAVRAGPADQPGAADAARVPRPRHAAAAGRATRQGGAPRRTRSACSSSPRNRVVIERVEPELDCGRHAIKRVVGDVVEVEADIFCDGHDKIAACIRYRAQDETDWREAPMALVDNDRWGGRFPVHRNCRYFYTIEAWRDLFESWRAEVMKKHDAGLDVGLELIEGRALIERTEEQAQGADRHALQALLGELEAQRGDQGALLHRMLGGRRARADEPRRHPHQRVTLRARARGVRRPAARQVRRLVRDVPALAERRSQPPRHLRRRDRAAALRPGHGLRCALLHADPPDRPRQPQGPQQHADPGAGRSRAARMPSAARRAATTRSIPSSAPSRTFTGWSRPPTRTAWRSRSTSRSNARPTIRGSRSIRSGSTGARTAPSNTPRTRPRSTRTSSTSTSIGGRCPRSGTRCATSCCSGSATA